jgi:hypothetical protein
MLVLTILAVIVLLGIVFLAYFFVNLCQDSRKGHAIVFCRDASPTLGPDQFRPLRTGAHAAA